jgi:hypothetical protein
LDDLYPDFIFFDPFGSGFRTWNLDQRIIQVRRMVAEGRCVLLQGRTASELPLHLEPEFSIEPIIQVGRQAIYRMHPGPALVASSRPADARLR